MSADDEEPRSIRWGSAQIQDGALSVELTGTASKAWRARFQGLLSLLDAPSRGWGAVKLRKNRIEIADVQEGSESELRHFLESVALQANAGSHSAQNGEVPPGGESESDPEAEMTATFRSFADEAEG